MDAIYRHGSALMVDHTPAAAVSAGDVVVVGDELRIAHSDIEANALGALAAPAGTAVYEVAKTTGVGEAFTAGDQVYWDATNSKAINDSDTGTHKKLGVTVAAAADADTTVIVRHAD